MKAGRQGGDTLAVVAMTRQFGDGVQEEITQKIHEEFRLLQTIFGVTRALCENAEANKIENVTDLLLQRERLLQRAQKLRDTIAPRLFDRKDLQELNHKALSLLGAITASNEALATILHTKKAEALQKLKDAQQHTSARFYSP